MTDGDVCPRCPHPFEPHVLAGDYSLPTLGFETPVAGWMTCPEPDCDCWSTWSISHPDLPDLPATLIDAYLQGLRRGRELAQSADHR